MKVKLKQLPVEQEHLYLDMISRQAFPLMGCMGEPAAGNQIALHKVSHAVTGMGVENDWLTAEIEIVKTPAGELLSKLIDRCVFRVASTESKDQVNLVTVYAVDTDLAS